MGNGYSPEKYDNRKHAARVSKAFKAHKKGK